MGVKFNPFIGNLDLVDSPNGEFDSIDLSGDITLDDGGTYTTTVQVVTPTANRTISFPDATGTVALVAGSSGQAIYNNAGALAGFNGLTIDGSGNLSGGGVGTTSPAVAWDVVGQVRASTGILFGTDTAAANALDDYEEGTWTPTIEGSTTAGAGSYSNRVGGYTKIGNAVFFKAYVIWSAHTGAGNLLLTGLPFASDATSGTFSAVHIGSISDVTLTANNIAPGGYIANNSTQCNFTQTPVGGGTATAIGFDASGNIILSGYYTV